MKILHITTSDKGGAGKACLRLHNALLSEGIDSKVLILDGEQNSNQKIFSFFNAKSSKIKKGIFLFRRHFLPTIYYIKLKKYNLTESFSFLSTFHRVHKHPFVNEADIIHLHYISDFIDYKSFFKKVQKPFVWTLHDMNPFSGGLHSPIINKINSNTEKKLIKLEKILKDKKKKIYENLKTIIFVSPSNWLFNMSSTSEILSKSEHKLIPHFINSNIFNLKDKHNCRKYLNWDISKKIILFVADRFSREIKGFDYLKYICNHYLNNEDIFFYSIGIDDNKQIFSNPNYTNLGFISSDIMLSIIYSASDILLQTSVHEAFSLTTLEALSCGLPVVAFDTTGIRELVINKFNGMLSSIGKKEDLIKNIEYILSNSKIYDELSKNAIHFTNENFNQQKIVSQYISLYEMLISKKI